MFKREFTEEQNMFRDAFRQFLAAEIVPNMEAWREQGVVDREAFTKAGEQGFLMTWVTEEYGGMVGDEDFRFEQIMIEELAYARSSDFYAPLHSRLVGPYLGRFGNEEQKQRYLPKCVTGELILGVAMTEPDAGSDLAGMRSTAVDKGDHWLLNGSKTYISNGINGDLFVVAAKSDPENARAISLFLVEPEWEGFERGRNLDKMGMKAQDTSELFFNNVKVPKENLLGSVHKGMHHLMHGLAEERLIGACGYLAAAQLSFDLTVEFVQERKAFGQRVADFQNTQFKLAELRTELDFAQVFIDRCVVAQNANDIDGTQAAQAKLVCSELQVKAAQLGVQLHGGAGYMDEYPISRQLTDAMISPIYAGTSEIMKMLISRDFLSPEYQPFNTRNF